jgi:hypothetical protein
VLVKAAIAAVTAAARTAFECEMPDRAVRSILGGAELVHHTGNSIRQLPRKDPTVSAFADTKIFLLIKSFFT